LLTECYRHAPMSTIAPFEYTSMLLGLGIGFMLFGDIPTCEMLIGSAVVMAAGGYIIYRERQLSITPQNTNSPQSWRLNLVITSPASDGFMNCWASPLISDQAALFPASIVHLEIGTYIQF